MKIYTADANNGILLYFDKNKYIWQYFPLYSSKHLIYTVIKVRRKMKYGDIDIYTDDIEMSDNAIVSI